MTYVSTGLWPEGLSSCLEVMSIIGARQAFSLGVILLLGDTGPRLGTSVVITLRVLLALSGWVPGMLLSSPQCPGGSHTESEWPRCQQC